MGELEPDLSEVEVEQWKEMIYTRALPIKSEPNANDGGGGGGIDDNWEEEASKQLAERDRIQKEKEDEERKTRASAGGNKGKKRGGRPSKANKPAEPRREGSSELSEPDPDADGKGEDEGGQDEEEEEGEEEDESEEEEEEVVSKTGRGRRANAGKRKRDSAAKEEESVEKDVKETVSLPLRKSNLELQTADWTLQRLAALPVNNRNMLLTLSIEDTTKATIDGSMPV